MRIWQRILAFLLLVLSLMYLTESIDEYEKKSVQQRKHLKSKSDDFGCSLGTQRYVLPYVVGGKPSEKHSWPWMLALMKKPSSGDPYFSCGATLISRQYVLTAAHCVENEDPSDLLILAGAHTLEDGVEYSIRKILIHPEYNTNNSDNDIALLHLKKEVKLSKEVRPVCLPSHDLKDSDFNHVTTTGWGDTSSGGEFENGLQEVNIPVIQLEECKTFYPKVTDNFICAGQQRGGKGSCRGDSGGPYLAKLKDDIWVQVGVVSFGNTDCSEKGHPTVAVKVSKYIKWLHDNTDLGKE